jgi:beta-lactamase regulating signal transducer with metallopeptidase domain
MIPLANEFLATAWTQIWQVTALIVAVAVLVRLVAKNRPHLAHVLWLVVLVKCLTPPWCASPVGVFSRVEGQWAGEPAPAACPPGELSLIVGPSPAELAPATATLSVEDAKMSSEPTGRSSLAWTGVALASAWALGTVLAAAVAAWRWADCLRRIRRSGMATDPEHGRCLTSLAGRLGIKPPARLVVTTSAVGPAVVGFLRHTIVLPECLLRGRSVTDLEPILAHELIHVRRGDTWIGLLRMPVECLWWFHPLVLRAGRLISREAERCCDEAVIAELGLKPADYARCLLGVLEQKQTIVPVPAFPGMRPVEVTSQRMERIMRLGQGSHARTPRWCWAVMLLAAAVTLPGAAWVGADPEPAAPAPANETKDARADSPSSPKPADPSAPIQRLSAGANTPWFAQPSHAYASPASVRPTVADKRLLVCTYETKDLLRRIQTQDDLDEETAKAKLLLAITESLDISKLFVNAGRDPATGVEFGVPVPASTEEPLAKDGLRWLGTTLVAEQTAGVHKRLVALLESIRAHAADESIQLEVRFIWGPSLEHPLGDGSLTLSKNSVTFQKEKASLTCTRFIAAIDEAQANKILDQFQNDPRANVMQGPKITLYNGQSGTIHDCSWSPFVVGVKEVKGETGSALQPEIQVVQEGTLLRLRPLLLDGGKVRLECRLTLSRIEKVDTKKIPDWRDSVATVETSRANAAITIQVPTVAKQEVDTAVEMSLGQTLLIAGLESPTDNKAEPMPMLVMIRPTKVEKRER